MSEINLKDVETGAVTSTVILGADQFDNAGRSIDFVGDLNGDGIEEILIGAPYAEQEAGGGQDAGAAYLVFGVAEPATKPLCNDVFQRNRLGTDIRCMSHECRLLPL